MIDRSLLQQANALLALSRNGLYVVGPTAATALVVTVGSGWALAVDALTWLVAAGCLGLLRVPAVERHQPTSVLSDLRFGWGEFTARTWVWLVVVSRTNRCAPRPRAACGGAATGRAGCPRTVRPVAATVVVGEVAEERHRGIVQHRRWSPARCRRAARRCPASELNRPPASVTMTSRAAMSCSASEGSAAMSTAPSATSMYDQKSP